MSHQNPFRFYSERLRGLRERFTSQMAAIDHAKLLTPRVGEMMGGIQAMIDEADDCAELLEELRRHDYAAFEVFQQVLEE